MNLKSQLWIIQFMLNCQFETDLEHHQDAPDNADVSIDHGFLHNVTDAAEVMGLNGMLFTQ